MTTVKLERIVSYSSEDPKYPAENLLKFGSKWKCKSPGEPNATVILQLDQPRVIETIDIGNEHSAFIHILVGRAASDEYESLLPASSFMSPLESDQSTNTNRVRMFTKQDFLQPAKDEKWDRIKVVCTQPFNKRVQYGLAFIVMKRPEDKPEPITFGRFKLKEKNDDDESPSVNLGRFHLKKENNDEDDSVSVGSFFAKRKELADKNDSSKTNGVSSPNNSGGHLLKPVLSPAQQKAVAKKVVKRNDDVMTKQTHVVPPKPKPMAAVQKPAPPIMKPKVNTPPTNKLQAHATTVKTPGKLPGKPNAALSTKTVTPPMKTKRPSWEDQKPATASKKHKPSAPKKTKPFSKLLEGVTIVISGYVNPARGILRSKALDMGAKYKQDWDSTCTHLICAFKNTPKFKQVQGHGCIVQKDWIEQCHAKRARLPWRRFALDLNDFKQPESEEEIEEEKEEVPQPSTSRSFAPSDLDMEIDNSAGCKAESGSDTEDEIERFEAKKKDTKTTASYNPYLSDTDIDDDDEERPDTSRLPMPPLPT